MVELDGELEVHEGGFELQGDLIGDGLGQGGGEFCHDVLLVLGELLRRTCTGALASPAYPERFQIVSEVRLTLARLSVGSRLVV
ncbi:hypothetical protein GCM10027079_30000 [Sediminivirga luteola]|uniref:Uncharacterized protein n=1 Tax=Sediminivirga luteola TaxID=1774748 RepID=A0A8J2XJW0_9MICO|nr:hypothetical protein GCM10011333_27490 [Sediminivirga luteola]